MNSPWLLAIAFVGFISLGLPDTVIGVAWPSVRETFGRHQSDLAAIFVGYGISYFLSSFFTGRLLGWFGVGTLLTLSSAIVAVGVIGLGASPVWIIFAFLPVLHGLGSGAIDAGLNHYVARHFSAKQMNWLHACYSVGAMLGPLIMTSVLAANASWRSGYFTVGAILLILTALFAFTRKQWNDPGTDSENSHEQPTVSAIEALRNKAVVLQSLFFFAYTGVEMTIGQWSFTVLTESRGLSEESAGIWVTVYWASILVGRVVFGFVVERVGIDRLIRIGLLLALLGTALFSVRFDAAVIALPLIGLGLAPLYPCMMTRTPQRLGTGLAAHAIGFQVSAAMLGVTVLPSGCGFLAEWTSPNAIPIAAAGIAFVLFGINELLLRGDKVSRVRGANPV